MYPSPTGIHKCTQARRAAGRFKTVKIKRQQQAKKTKLTNAVNQNYQLDTRMERLPKISQYAEIRLSKRSQRTNLKLCSHRQNVKCSRD